MSVQGHNLRRQEIRLRRRSVSREKRVRHVIKTSLLAFLLLVCQSANAHESRPALLEITELSGGDFDILWKVPVSGGSRPKLTPIYPEHCSNLSPYQVLNTATALVERSRLRCSDKGLHHGAIEIGGLTLTITDVFLRINSLEGGSVSTVLHASQPIYNLPDRFSTGVVITSYFKLGAQHILSGADHLLFVIGLLILVQGLRPLLVTITSFTFAHSLTLALAALGIVPAPTSVIESLIALSIMFLAVEILRRRTDRKTWSGQRPYLLALFFGLLHGMGFAGALLAVGLPEKELLVALLFFNLGVEAGQVLFVAMILSLCGIILKLPYPVPKYWSAAASYIIGTTGAFWLFQRLNIIG